MIKSYNRFYAGFIAIIAGVISGIVFYILAMILGVITGVVAMCATAPSWWIIIFSLAFLFGFFSSVICTGRWAYKCYCKACRT